MTGRQLFRALIIANDTYYKFIRQFSILLMTIDNNDDDGTGARQLARQVRVDAIHPLPASADS